MRHSEAKIRIARWVVYVAVSLAVAIELTTDSGNLFSIFGAFVLLIHTLYFLSFLYAAEARRISVPVIINLLLGAMSAYGVVQLANTPRPFWLAEGLFYAGLSIVILGIIIIKRWWQNNMGPKKSG